MNYQLVLLQSTEYSSIVRLSTTAINITKTAGYIIRSICLVSLMMAVAVITLGSILGVKMFESGQLFREQFDYGYEFGTTEVFMCPLTCGISCEIEDTIQDVIVDATTSWNNLRRLAKELGITAKKKVDIIKEIGLIDNARLSEAIARLQQ